MDALLYRIRKGFATLIDLVVPRKERRMRAESLRPEDLIIEPGETLMLGSLVTTLAPYANLRDPIQALKYDRSRESARLLAVVLGDFLRDEITSLKQYSSKPVLLIPIPLDAKRNRDRGYNQIGMVINALPIEFADGALARIAAPVLERTRATRQQTRLVRAARLSNVAGAFALSDPSLVRGTHVYLIDDVATTGATLVNAAKPLRDAGAEVTLLALARA